MRLYGRTQTERHQERAAELERLMEKHGAVITEADDLIVATWAQGNLWLAKLWRGNAARPTAFYNFAREDRRDQYVAERFAHAAQRCADRAAAMQQRKATRAALRASNLWNVGDVVHTSWGYDQTNVEFYQITAVKPRSVIVRQIARNSSDHGGPSGGKCAPRRYEYVGPEIFCPLSNDGSFSAGPCYQSDKPSFRNRCSLWRGGAVYTSSNH